MEDNLRIGIIIGSIFIAAVIITRVSRWLITRSYKLASHKLKVDPTRYRFAKNALSLIIWLIALGSIASFIPELKSSPNRAFICVLGTFIGFLISVFAVMTHYFLTTNNA